MTLDSLIAAGLEISLGVLASLVALWIVFGRQSWIVRLAGLLGFAAPFAWAGVHDFLIIWGTQVVALLIIRAGTECAGRLYRAVATSVANRENADGQYSLKKLLIGTIPAALLFAELHYTSLDSQDVVGNIAIGAVWGIAAACVWLARFGAAPLALHWLGFLLFVPALGYALDFTGLSGTVPSQLSGSLPMSDLYFLVTTCLQAVLLMVAVYLWKWLPLVGMQKAISPSQRRPLPTSVRRLDSIIRRSAVAMGAAIFLAIVGPGATLYVYMSSTPRRQSTPVPMPNAYSVFIAAGRQPNLQDVSGDPQDATGNALTAVMSKNQALLDSVHQATRGESQVPLSYRRRDIDAAVADAPWLRQLCRTLIGEAKLLEYKGRTAQATEVKLDCIRMAMLSERGGLIIHSLVGVAISGVGVTRLREQVPLLDASKCRELTGVLAKLDQDVEPIDNVIERDRLWCRIAFGWRGQSSMLADELLNRSSPGYQATRSAYMRRAAFLRLLIGEFAVRAFEVEQQQLPDSLNELTPDYLPSVLIDPYDGQPLRYRRTQSDYNLYSVGEDGIDNGGTPASPQQPFGPGTDLILETLSGSNSPSDAVAETADKEEMLSD